MRAWLFQDCRQKRKLGDEKCPWSVGWIDPDGRKRSKRVGTKSNAEKYRRKIEGELAAGTYKHDARKSWKDFRIEYEARIAIRKSAQSRRCDMDAMNHFERIIKPQRLSAIKTQAIDAYVTVRSTERGRKRNSRVSPASINKELRHLKAVLRIAHDWGYLTTVPKFRMLKEPGKIVRYVTPEDFAKIYEACDSARLPDDLTYSPADWWRGLLTFAYMTGWRVCEVLALRRDDLDLTTGEAITRADDNKGRRDELVRLHPVVVEHLKRIVTFAPLVFTWNHHRRALWSEFERIQRRAGIHLPCHENHEHTSACHCYGFHDFRRAFATVNAEAITPDALQALMRHKAYATTQRYINMARQLDRAVEKLYVPPGLKTAGN